MKEDPDDFLQLIQWHMSFLNGRPDIVNVTAVQRHDPFAVLRTSSLSCVDGFEFARGEGEAAMIAVRGSSGNECESLQTR